MSENTTFITCHVCGSQVPANETYCDSCGAYLNANQTSNDVFQIQYTEDNIVPVQPEQVQPETVQFEPVQPEPVQFNPVQPETMQFNPIQPEPVQEDTIQIELAQPEAIKPEDGLQSIDFNETDNMNSSGIDLSKAGDEKPATDDLGFKSIEEPVANAVSSADDLQVNVIDEVEEEAEEEELDIFAKGLPDWDLVPLNEFVRRRNNG